MTFTNRQNAIRLIISLLSVTTLFASAACGSASAASGGSQAATNPLAQETITPGTLTIATGEPAYTPFVIDNKPETGKGFESALAYAVGEKMGFKKDQIQWTRTTFDSAIAPGAKDYDMNIQQFGITEERKKAVDFTPSYYNAAQALVVRKDSKYASATSVQDFKGATIGAMVGTTSYDMAKSKLKSDIKTFNDNVAVAQAVDANQIDALVVDSTVAVNIVKTQQVHNAKVVGQIPDSEDPNGTGILLPKGSKLTKAASQAITDLEKDGTLKRLQDTWLKEYTTDIPVLK